MIRKPSKPESARRTRKTLFIIAGVYVCIGFFVAVPAALRADPLSAFLGFIIVSGALVCAVGLDVLLRLGVHLSEVGDAMDDLRDRLDRIEQSGLALNTSECGTGFRAGQQNTGKSVPPSTAMIDLAALGNGDPSVLTAATLDRSVFPRLAAAMEQAPPPMAEDTARTDDESLAEATCEEGRPKRLWHRSSTGQEHGLQTRATPPLADIPAGLTTRNLLRAWRVALRDGDLQSCRSVFSALVDTVEPERLAPLETLLKDLTDRKEQSLRKAFSNCIVREDFAGALHISEQICTLLPDHRIADDFQQIRPRLQRRLREQEISVPPRLAVVR